MQDPSDSGETPGSAEIDVTDSEPSTVLVEVLPGVAVVAGEFPPELKPDLVDFGIVPAADRRQISAILASIGSATALAGNLGKAFADVQGLYRLGDATQALLKGGAALAPKDGGFLGTVTGPGGTLHQARLYPVASVGKAQIAASVGPALAMIALQMMLNEVSSLVRTTLAVTNQVLTAVRKDQWAELAGLVAAVDRAVEQAREIESVPTSLWDDVAGSGALLRKQLELYQGNVRDHVGRISRADARGQREYLQSNTEVITFDVHALLSSLNAWTGYHALRAGRARGAGREDAAEAQYAEVIARDTRAEFDTTLAAVTSLVGALVRELRITVELREPDAWPLSGKRKDVKAARDSAARLLAAIEPLADALHPPVPPLEVPNVLCGPRSVDSAPYLRVLRWHFEDGESLHALGFPEQLDGGNPISAIVGGAMEMFGAASDKPAGRPVVAVTDRRIVLASTTTFLEQAEIDRAIPIDQVRYVRAPAAPDGGSRRVIDLITRDDNIRWVFHPDVETGQVDALAAVLAESMTIPDVERDELRGRRPLAVEADVSG